jgi:glycosyltransferase involved in cell wall biosynthesis
VRWPAGSRDLVDCVRDWRPEIVNSHGGRWDKFPILVHACRLARVPFVQTLHGTSFEGNLGEKTLASLRRASALTSVSEAVRQFFSARLGDRSRITLIANAVDNRAAAAASPFRRERPYIFSAARLDLSNKAIDTLVSAFAMVAAEFPEVDLLIAGEGPDRETLAVQAAALTNLHNRVELLGVRGRDEMWSLYKGSLFFAMPSRLPEGEGLVYREAMACGKAVIGSRSGGTPELVREGVSGLLVESEPGEIASALRTLLANPALREEMGNGAHAAGSIRSWPEVAERYLEVYTSSLTSG